DHRHDLRVGAGDRAAQGHQGRRDRRHRTRSARGDDPGRPGCRRDPGREAGRRGECGTAEDRPAHPRAAERGDGSQEPGRAGGAARPHRRGGRPHRGDASRGHRAARHRPGPVPGPQPSAGLRPDDRVGTGRSAGPVRRPRHELHLDRGGAARTGTGPRTTALPEQPRRRLRWRLDVPRHRRPRRPPRGEDERAGTGRGRRDRRRRRPPQPHVGRDAGRRVRPGTALGEPAGRRHPLLRPLRDRRRQAHVRRLAGAAVLRGARAAARHRRPGPRPARLQHPRRAARHPHRDVQAAHPGRVGRDLRRQRRVLRPGAATDRGRRAPTHEGARRVRRARRPPPAGPGSSLLADGGDALHRAVEARRRDACGARGVGRAGRREAAGERRRRPGL
ncbi:MAG: Alpha-methylacyl-CoA racemase, partial [uncultured Nocardioidaceae bacterium]